MKIKAPAGAPRAPAASRRRATGTPKPWLVAATRRAGRAAFRGLFALEVVGVHRVPATGPVLLAGNHAAFLDGPLVYATSPRSATFLAKSELFVGPLARAMGWLGQVPVHRGKPDRAALKAGLLVLADGGALGVFPEGSRGTGTLEQIADGLAYLALRSGAVVVPVAVIGTAAALPKGSALPRWRAPVRVVFGDPITVVVPGDPRSRRTVSLVAEQLRLALVAHLHTASAQLPDIPNPRSNEERHA